MPQVTVTSGITAAARARGDLFTVMPEVGPTPYRARATEYSTLVGKNIEEGAQKQEKQYVFRLGIETVKNSGENSRK